MFHKLFLLAVAFFLLPLPYVQAQNLTQAEKDFQDGNFAKALPQYEQITQTASGADKYQAQLRAAACAFSLGEFLNSAKMLLSYELPQDPLWKARFLLYRTYASEQVANVYNPLLEQREIDDTTAQNDPEQWTRAQWNKQQDKDYKTLWSLRAHLINAPIESENLILTLKDTDTRRIATLFDFAAHRYVTWLKSQASSLTPLEPRTYLNGQATPDKTAQDKAAHVSSLLQTAATLEGVNRQDARVFWQTDFILLPFDQQNWFTFNNKENAVNEAQTQLYALSGYHTQTSLWAKVKNWVFSDDQTALYGRSYTLYRTAQLLRTHQRFQDALDVCTYAQTLPRSYYTDQCQDLRTQITAEDFHFNTLPRALNPQTPALEVSARNIHTLYGRIYPVSFQELENFRRKNMRNTQVTSWDFLHELSNDTLQTLLKSAKNYTSFTQKLTYEKPYTSENFTLKLPPLSNGFYAVLISAQTDFNAADSPVYGIMLNSTDLSLFTTAAIEDSPADYVWTLTSTPTVKTPNVFRFYTVNLKTGQAEPNTQLTVLTDWQGTQQTLTTNAQGQTGLARTIRCDEHANNYYHVQTLAQKNGHYAYTSSVAFHYYPAAPVRLFAQTDRAIYRPGQKVLLAANLVQRTVSGYDVLPNTPCTLTVTNTAGEKVFSQTLTSNQMGTVQTAFTLPDDNPLLGNFSLRAETKVKNRTYTDYYSFKVEEYKRPDYEISLPTDADLQYNKPVTLTGHAQYYFGTPLMDATVKYSVVRQPYIPPFYWWWFNRPNTPEEVVAQGDTKTDKKGNFTLSFTPTASEKDEHFAQYRVKAEVYDESGRAIDVQKTYKVSLKPHLFKVAFTNGFYDADTPLENVATLNLTDAQGQSVAGRVRVKLDKLKNAPDLSKETRRWEETYQETPAEKTIFTTDYTFQKQPQSLRAAALAEGVYRLTLSSDKADEQQLYFLVVKDGTSLRLPALALAQHTAYLPGETARILLGASDLKNTKWVEITQQNAFLNHVQTLPGGVSVFEQNMTEKDRGGLVLSWFGASDYRFYQGSTSLEVPFDNKELTVSLNVPDVVTPGEKVNWTLTAKDSAKNPVNGQASISVYDASLDYYAKKENPFNLTTFFAQQLNLSPLGQSFLTGYTSTLNKKPYKGRDYEPAPQLPLLNLQMSRRMYKGAFGTRNLMLARAAAPMAAGLADSKMAFASVEQSMEEAAYGVNFAADLAETASSAALSADEQTAPTDTETLRSYFAETAYFNAQLPLTNGQAPISFKMPDSLTTWNIVGFVLTKDVNLGTFTLNTLSRKDFMVRLQLPRFYREGDKGVLQAAVTNLTNQKITVPVTLTVRLDGKEVNTSFGLTKPTQNVTVKPQATAFVSWPITAPANPNIYQLTAAAHLGKTTDGEQKDFLILPGFARLMATVNKSLHAGPNTLLVSEVAQDPSAKPQSAVLNLHPSLALSVLNTMPNLLTSPHNDLVSSLNRYVPLAVVHQFYTTYPQLKQAVKKLPARSGLSAPWNEKDPLRLTLLDQTPWLRQARGQQHPAENIINLFDAKEVEKQLNAHQKNILQFQNPSGAFTWFAGGKDDDYLTLYALESFAQALNYNAPIPQVPAQKAFAYIVPQIEKRLRQDKQGTVNNVSFALYAAYTLSSFPQEWAQVSQAKATIQKWVDYADSQARFMTPLGQIYAAAVYHRLGDDLKANRYLDNVLSRLKQNDLTGAYFAPEAQSWIWYNDTLTTQTVTLHTLLKMRPDSPYIEPMLKWVLFNRQVNEWNNPKSAAQAVFTVLDVMQTQGVLSTPVSYQIKWDPISVKRTFKPFDWTEDLQFVKQPVSPADYQAQITKSGGAADFASLSVVYLSNHAKASPKGVLNVTRDYFVRFTENGVQKLRPVKDVNEVNVGDEVEVHLTLTTDSAFEYVLLDDPKPAGFESEALTSGWEHQNVSFYREVKDAQTRFFINWLPAGKVTLRYVLRPTLEGQLNVLPAQVQSMYAPEYGAHTSSMQVKVIK